MPATNNYHAYQFAYRLTLILIGYFAITQFLRNERDLQRFLSVLASIHIYVAAKVFLGYNPTGFDQTGYQTQFIAGSSFLGDENDVALAMIVILPFVVYLFRHTRSFAGRFFWGTGSVVIFLSIILTFSRRGFVGLTAMVVYWVVTRRNKSKAIGAMALAVALVIAVAPARYWERIQTITETESGTAQVRRNNWAAARRMFYDLPIWGVGGNNFAVLLPDYALEYSPEKRATRWGRVSHSMYFDLLAEFGLIGVFLIASVLVLNFRNLRYVIGVSREGDCSPSIGQLADSLRISWVGFLVSAAFLSVLSYPHLYYLTALTVVVHELASVQSAPIVSRPVVLLEESR